MIPLHRWVAGIFSLLIIIVVIDLVRRKKLREEYSILWLLAGFVIILFAIKSDIINWMANLLGIQHPAYAMIVIALLIGLVMAIHFTIVLSKLTAQVWRLTQEIGLLEEKVDRNTSMEHANSLDN